MALEGICDWEAFGKTGYAANAGANKRKKQKGLVFDTTVYHALPAPLASSNISLANTICS
jgi:hypothetical protein